MALQRLVNHDVPESEEVLMHAHLDQCPSCKEAYDRQVEAKGDEQMTLPFVDTNAGAPDCRDDSAKEKPSAVEVAPSAPTLSQRSDTTPAAVSKDQSVLDLLKEFLEPAPSPDEPGRLGRYRVLRLLGAGGMGVVVEAEDLNLPGRRVALKLIRPRPDAPKNLHERFRREARALAVLKSDHIVPILDYGEVRGVPFIAMPLLDGQTLAERVGNGRKLPVLEVLQVGREVADGLEAARLANWIHRDIKPWNIFLEKHGNGYRVVLLDFGIAALAPDLSQVAAAAGDPGEMTPPWAVVGTPGYLSPEAAVGGQITHQSDLFGLGCVLYRVSTGRQTFRGRTRQDLLWDVLTYHPQPPHELNPDVPRPLSDLIMRLLAKDPKDRPASAGEVVSALQEIEEWFQTENRLGILVGALPKTHAPRRSHDRRKSCPEDRSQPLKIRFVSPDGRESNFVIDGEAVFDPATGLWRFMPRPAGQR
jgi:serine/threonine protein kinase